MRQREISAELTSKYGFSVVAPTSVTRPSSTAGSSASCCALLKRWISSRKKIVGSPLAASLWSARSSTSRTSWRPAFTADASSNAAWALAASMRASVVLPVPGGPYRIIECGRPCSVPFRSAESGPSRCAWPTNSSRFAGRMRTASGCSSGGTPGRAAREAGCRGGPAGGSGLPRRLAGRVEELFHARILAAVQTYTRCVPEAQDLERRTTELLQRLIRFNTVNPPGNEQAAQEHLREQLESAGFECELLSAVEGRPNLVARLPGRSDGPRLCYLGHVDTVLADASDWTVDPWSGELKDGCVWGRGALDMKSQVAAEIAAACSLAEEGWRPESGELMGIVTADEGAGAAHGAKWLCEQVPDKVRCDVVVNEGGGDSFMFDDTRYYG